MASRGWERIRDLQSDRVISTACFSSFGDIVEGRWIWLKDSIARHYDCDIDDVDLVEMDNGNDILTARGRHVAKHEIG